jgi:AAA domain
MTEASPQSVPFMITREMKDKLRARGFDDAAIADLTPAKAHEILNQDDEPEAAGPKEDQGVVIALEMLKARHTPPEKDPNKQYPYELAHFDDLRPGRRSPYIVDGLIPINGLVTAWGAPKCGKSFWTFDLAMHIAFGWPYRGRRVEKGPVVYCAFEGAEGFHARAEAFRRTHDMTPKNPWDTPWFYLLASNAKLVRDHKALIESMHGQTDRPPTVVVLDTLNRSIDGSESKDQDMGAYLAAAEAIIDAFDCVVIIVHHCGVDGTRPRGHTSLSGAASVQIAVRRDADRNVVAEVEAMKDGPEGASFTSSLQVIEVGTDDFGKPITSCAIVPIAPAPASTNKGAGGLSANQRRFLDILTDALLDPPPEHKTTINIPGGAVAISREWLKTCCIAKGWIEEADSNRRQKINNMINALAGKHLIGASSLYVWSVR